MVSRGRSVASSPKNTTNTEGTCHTQEGFDPSLFSVWLRNRLEQSEGRFIFPRLVSCEKIMWMASLSGVILAVITRGSRQACRLRDWIRYEKMS
eukprot:1143991-Amorphochlora_amoeboformis.AAC.1